MTRTITIHNRVVLVCGGRYFTNGPLVRDTLDRLHAEARIGLIVHGACPLGGADWLAHAWGYRRGVLPIPVPPDADLRDDPQAGPRRNAKMLTEYRPGLVVAFPGGKGTRGMVRLARKAGVPVVEVAP